VAYTVKPVFAEEQESITLHIDGQAVELARPTHPRRSPGPLFAGRGYVGEVQRRRSNEYGSYSGLWAVFRFIQDADAHSGSVVEMKLKSGKSDVEVKHNGKPVVVKSRY